VCLCSPALVSHLISLTKIAVTYMVTNVNICHTISTYKFTAAFEVVLLLVGPHHYTVACFSLQEELLAGYKRRGIDATPYYWYTDQVGPVPLCSDTQCLPQSRHSCMSTYNTAHVGT